MDEWTDDPEQIGVIERWGDFDVAREVAPCRVISRDGLRYYDSMMTREIWVTELQPWIVKRDAWVLG